MKGGSSSSNTSTTKTQNISTSVTSLGTGNTTLSAGKGSVIKVGITGQQQAKVAQSYSTAFQSLVAGQLQGNKIVNAALQADKKSQYFPTKVSTGNGATIVPASADINWDAVTKIATIAGGAFVIVKLLK